MSSEEATTEDVRATRYVDRSGWPNGPWDAEDDRIEWKTEAGLPALIVRNTGIGNLCGYVGVPKGHVAHGKGYDDVQVDVHGGLTYAESCGGRICHIPAPGESDDVWWLGFDCAHLGDNNPGMRKYPMRGHSSYKDVLFVRSEVESLAKQLSEMK